MRWLAMTSTIVLLALVAWGSVACAPSSPLERCAEAARGRGVVILLDFWTTG